MTMKASLLLVHIDTTCCCCFCCLNSPILSQLSRSHLLCLSLSFDLSRLRLYVSIHPSVLPAFLLSHLFLSPSHYFFFLFLVRSLSNSSISSKFMLSHGTGDVAYDATNYQKKSNEEALWRTIDNDDDDEDLCYLRGPSKAKQM